MLLNTINYYKNKNNRLLNYIEFYLDILKKEENKYMYYISYIKNKKPNNIDIRDFMIENNLGIYRKNYNLEKYSNYSNYYKNKSFIYGKKILV